jgi:hypothetical protein
MLATSISAAIGSRASRVHSTTPSGRGHPEATPSAKGYRVTCARERTTTGGAKILAAASDHAALRSRRRDDDVDSRQLPIGLSLWGKRDVNR